MQIVLADDHQLVLDALELYFKQLDPGIDVERATDFDQAVKRVGRSTGLDLIILDINMPGMNGLEGLEIMRKRVPGIPVVLLSGDSDAELVRKALARGAAGFIPKELTGQAMLKALELVLCGEVYVPPLALAKDPIDLGVARDPRFAQSNPLTTLTPRELQILKSLCRGYTNKGIARELEIQCVTVAFHLKGVFRKLDVVSRTEAATLAMRLGLANP